MCYVNIASGNSLVPSGNNPLSEPTMTQFIDTYMCHQASMS